MALVSSHSISPLVSEVNAPHTVLISFFMFSLLLLLIWTLGAQSSAPMWVSISIAIHRRMKVPSGPAYLAHVFPPSASHLDLGS